MTKEAIGRITSAVVGLALVGYGGWLAIQGQQDMAALLVAGGLGTLGLPAVYAKSAKGGES